MSNYRYGHYLAAVMATKVIVMAALCTKTHSHKRALAKYGGRKHWTDTHLFAVVWPANNGIIVVVSGHWLDTMMDMVGAIGQFRWLLVILERCV